MLTILSFIFKIIVGIRNYAFDNGTLKSHKCKAFVISVGNLSAGGTGKTPFTIMLSNMLSENGFKTAVVGRGYGREHNKYTVVSDGENIKKNPDECGDEMILIAQRTGSIVIANTEKYEAALRADGDYSPHIIIVDDGFQHRQLSRDIDILLIDEQTVKNSFMMPRGRLREPLNSAKRADLICIKNNINQKYLKQFEDCGVLLKYDNYPSGKSLFFSASEELDLEIENTKMGITLVSAIANSSNFEGSVENMGYNILTNIRFADHHSYSIEDVKTICQKMKDYNIFYLGTTEKDFVKLRRFEKYFRKKEIKVLVFEIESKISHQQEDFNKFILERIRGAKN